MEFTALTEGLQLALPTIPTPERTRVALRPTVRTEVEVWARHIIPTPGPMRLPGRVRVHMDLGVNPSYPMVTDPPTPSITRMRTALSQRPKAHKEELPPPLPPSMGTAPWLRPPAVTCTPATMATFTRIPVTVGVRTIMETGTR